MNDLVDLLTGKSVDIPGVHLLTGEVTDTTVTPPLIQVGASTAATPCPTVAGYRPEVGDFVEVLVAGAARICVGKIATGNGVSLRRVATQSATGAASVAVSWDTEDYDQGGFWTSGTNITVPTGGGGSYGFEVTIVGAGNWTVGSNVDVLVGGTARARFYNGRLAARLLVGGFLRLAAADVVTVEVFNNGTTQNMTGFINLAAIG